MPETDPLFQAILADPDDDALRLIYADWLEERGDARGEFLRVQCALAKLAEDDPRRDELELRERELLAGHREAWLGALPSWDGITWKEFGRGFVVGVEATFEAFRARADEMFRLAPVEQVCFREVEAADAAALADSPHLARLTGLSFTVGGDTADAVATALAASPSLTRLTQLRFDGIGDAGPTALAGSPNLRRLKSLWLQERNYRNLPGRITLEGIAALVASPHLTGLSKLSLYRTPSEIGAGDPVAAALAASPRLATLTELFLPYAGISAAGAQALAASPHLARLTSLDLWANAINEGGAAALAGSPHLARLTHLALGANHLADPDAVALASSPHLSRLTRLVLRYNDVGLRGAVALVASPHLRRLRSLDLRGNKLANTSAAALAASFRLAELTSLDLGENGVGDAGAAALAASPQLSPLTHLDLANRTNFGSTANRVGDAGAVALATSPHLAGLARLDLDGNPVGSLGQRALLARFGDPLGEMVGVETELAQLSPHDPRRAGLQGRKARLLAGGALPEHTALTVARVSARGVAEEVVTHAQVFVDRAEALFQAVPSLCRVRLRPDWPDKDVKLTRLAASPYLARLTTLGLRDNELNDDAAQALATCPHLANLTALDLRANRIGDLGAEALAASPHLGRLTTLDLCDNPLGDGGEQALRERFGRGVVRLRGRRPRRGDGRQQRRTRGPTRS